MGPDVATDEIASLADSKSMLYANFVDKESLIEAVIRREADLTIADEEFATFAGPDVTSDSLIKFGIRFVSFINSHDLLGWDRLIASLEATLNCLGDFSTWGQVEINDSSQCFSLRLTFR